MGEMLSRVNDDCVPKVLTGCVLVFGHGVTKFVKSVPYILLVIGTGFLFT